MKFSVPVDRLFRYHLLAIGLLAAAYMFTVAGFELYGLDTMKGLTRLFSMDAEENMPEFFSAIALLLVAAACLVCANAPREKERSFWMVVAIVFLFLSVDEAVSIHELTGPLMKEFFPEENIYFRAWVVPYGIGLLIFVGWAVRPLLRLPVRTRGGLVIAGCVYVMGAMGLEFVPIWVDDYMAGAWITKSLAKSLSVLGEETLEMLGVALALRTCLLHVAGPRRRLTLNVAAGVAAP